MNQTLETYLRNFVSHAQDDWYDLLPSAQLAISDRNAASTGISPFFLMHGYHLDHLNIREDLGHTTKGQKNVTKQKNDGTTRDWRRTKISPIAEADDIVRKLRDAREWAQTSMAAAQQAQEENTNRHRQQAPHYKPGDKVWLTLKNITTDRPAKKLDAKQAKYTVIESVGSHSYRLDTPPGMHDVFHTQLLRPVANDPLTSQENDDSQPIPLLIGENADNIYDVEDIRDEKTSKNGRKKYLVKWKKWARPTWEPATALEDTTALVQWLSKQRKGRK